MNNIPIIGQQEEPKFPMKKIDVTPNGEVIVQILLAPDIILSTTVLTVQDMINIDRFRMEIKLQQKKELGLVRHALETKSRD